MDKKQAFIKEYFELCERHGFYVRNNYCCCGSSSVESIPEPLPDDEYSYEWEKFSEQKNDLEKEAKAEALK